MPKIINPGFLLFPLWRLYEHVLLQARYTPSSLTIVVFVSHTNSLNTRFGLQDPCSLRRDGQTQASKKDKKENLHEVHEAHEEASLFVAELARPTERGSSAAAFTRCAYTPATG